MARPKIKVKQYEYTYKIKELDIFDYIDKETGKIKQPKSKIVIGWRDEKDVKNNIDFDKENNPHWHQYEYTLTGKTREVEREMTDEEKEEIRTLEIINSILNVDELKKMFKEKNGKTKN